MELAWRDLDPLLAFIEKMFVSVLGSVGTVVRRSSASSAAPPDELRAIRAPFPRLTYAAAIERLRTQGFPLEWGVDLGSAEERALTLESPSPLFLTHFPRALKAFYMLRSADDPRTVEAADLLGPEGYGELIGASCRETQISHLVERLRAIGPTRGIRNGTSTCVATGTCRTRGSALGSSGSSAGCSVASTSARRHRSRGRRPGTRRERPEPERGSKVQERPRASRRVGPRRRS